MNRLSDLVKDLLSEKVYLIHIIYFVCTYAYADKSHGLRAARSLISRCEYEVK